MTIPSTLRVPGRFFVTDNSLASTSAKPKSTLLVGQMLAAGTAVADALIQITAQAADTEFGVGSQLARMVRAYRATAPSAELFCIPLDDDGGSADATGTVTIVGTATADGQIVIRIGGQAVTTVITSGDTETDVTDQIVLDVTAATQLPVTAGNVAGVVTYTAKNGGTLGNDLQISINFFGAAALETLPAGITASVTAAMAGGATDPSLTAAIAAMTGTRFNYLGQPYTDTTNLDLWETEYDFVTGRWAPLTKEWGSAWTAQRGTQGALTTAGNLRNDANMRIFGMEPTYQTPVYEVAAMVVGLAAVNLGPNGSGNAARQLTTLVLNGALPPLAANRFTLAERDTLLHDGIATLEHKGGISRIERAITTYQLDTSANADDSFLDAPTMATLEEIEERMDDRYRTKYPRHKLVNDGTKFNSGQAVITPKGIFGEWVALLREFEAEALVENVDLIIANSSAVRDGGDPNRVNMIIAPDLANQFRILDVRNQFRLQFPAAA